MAALPLAPLNLARKREVGVWLCMAIHLGSPKTQAKMLVRGEATQGCRGNAPAVNLGVNRVGFD